MSKRCDVCDKKRDRHILVISRFGELTADDHVKQPPEGSVVQDHTGELWRRSEQSWHSSDPYQEILEWVPLLTYKGPLTLVSSPIREVKVCRSCWPAVRERMDENWQGAVR